jgi:hypothetical protein
MRIERPGKENNCGMKTELNGETNCGMKSTEKMTNKNHNVIPTEVGI